MDTPTTTGSHLWGRPNVSTPGSIHSWINFYLALRVAATLTLADSLSGTPLTAPEIVQLDSRLNEDAVDRLLHYLAARGVFDEVETGVYVTNDRARLLMSDHPSGLRLALDLDGPFGRRDQAWCGGLLRSVRSGLPSYDALFGHSYADDLATDPIFKSRYDADMLEHAQVLGPEIAEAYSWDGVGVLVDVGGGTGSILSAILRAHPHLAGILVETPPTSSLAIRAIEESGLAARCRVDVQDVDHELPAGDAFLLSRVLHGLDDAEATTLLRRCLASCTSTGRLLIAESIESDSRSRPMASFINLAMLVMYGSPIGERTRTQFETLAGSAGWRPVGLIRLPSGWGLHEFQPA